MQGKRWVFLNKEHDRDVVMATAERLSVSPVIITLLFNRGITSDKEITAFLSKSMQTVHNPMLLPDMEKAVIRIVAALENNEKICIYGDYDVDGITSTVLMYKYLLAHGADVSYYIPDRITEGYGINIKAINKISKTGCKLIITVDCGITAVGETELAKAQGMDVIITDHHTCKEKIPNATAVINPKREDSEYPFPHLAGVGVTFKTVLAISMKLGEDTKATFTKYAPYAAIGTVADVVSLTDENRVITHRGILSAKENPTPGLAALMEISGITELSTGTVAYAVAPRINAAGRMGNANLAAELLICESKKTAAEIAAELNTENQRRRVCEKNILDEAEAIISKNPSLLSKPILVIGGEMWHQGVVGIVASRLSEKYYKPVILVSFEDGKGHGSCRSIEGFNIFDALNHCDELLEKFGGHAMAAGLSVDESNFEEFEKKINAYGAKNMPEEALAPTLNIDCTISASAMTEHNVNILSSLEPFGEGNSTPVFAITGAAVASAMQIGDGGAHLRLQLIKDGCNLSCIAFRMGNLCPKLTPGKTVDIAFTPEINTYNGRRSVQLRIADIIC